MGNFSGSQLVNDCDFEPRTVSKGLALSITLNIVDPIHTKLSSPDQTRFWSLAILVIAGCLLICEQYVREMLLGFGRHMLQRPVRTTCPGEIVQVKVVSGQEISKTNLTSKVELEVVRQKVKATRWTGRLYYRQETGSSQTVNTQWWMGTIVPCSVGPWG